MKNFGTIFAFLMLTLSVAAATAVKTCAVCGRRMINRRYYTMNGKVYCSQACLDKALPKCRSCGKVLRGRSVTVKTDKLNFYCTECAALPRCFCCQLPGRTEELSDGRRRCPECRKNAVADPDEARRLFDGVRKKLAELGIEGCGNLTFFPVGRKRLRRVQGRDFDELELGLYRHEVQKNIVTRTSLFGKEETREDILSDRCAIYIYDSMERRRFCETAAHEIAHDWMEHHFPGVKSDWIREGFAEYVASLYNRASGNAAANWRMEANPDPVYGDGYRRIKSIAEEKGFDGLLEYLRTAR